MKDTLNALLLYMGDTSSVGNKGEKDNGEQDGGECREELKNGVRDSKPEAVTEKMSSSGVSNRQEHKRSQDVLEAVRSLIGPFMV